MFDIDYKVIFSYKNLQAQMCLEKRDLYFIE